MANMHVVGATVDVPVVTTAETVLATTSSFPVGNTLGQGVAVWGVINFTTGTSTTAVVIRVRRGGLTGTLIGEAQTHTIGAAVSANIPFDVLDTATVDSSVAVSYSVTIVQTAASANGTGNSSTIHAQSTTSSE